MTYTTKQGNDSRLIIVAVLFLLSGAAGLIYEIVWERLLEIYFGVTMTAITLIVAAYLGGLGLGSLIGGLVAQKIKRVVLTYGLVEVAIAIFGFFSPSLINRIGERTAGSPYLVVFLLSFALLLIPTLLMGMTLPLLTQSFVNRVDTSGRVIGLLYGINTLGAGIGALVGGFILIGWLGFDGATNVAVALNLLVGIGAILLMGVSANAEPKQERAGRPDEKSVLSYSAILIAAFLVGFINLGFEILWFRVLGILNKNTAYGFPSVLFVFLAGLAIGGFIWGRKADDSKDRMNLFWKLQLGSGIVTALSFLFFWGALHFPPLQQWIRESFGNPQQPVSAFVRIGNEFVFSRRLMLAGLFEYFLPIVILVLPASLVMGGGLPILDRIAITSVQVSGRRVGDIHLANILGSVAGSLASSFLLLPLLGTELTLKLLAILSLVFIVLFAGNRFSFQVHRIMPLPATLVALLLILPGRGEFYNKLYETATGIHAVVHESGETVLALGYTSEPTAPSTMWIGGIQNSYFPTYGDYERSVFTCASASHPKRILIIGLGGSNSAYFLTQMPNVESLVIVELMEDLGPLLNQYAPVAQRTLNDPRVQYIPDDGRRYLYANPGETYDLIFIDPLYSFTAGHNNLYSQEAMELYGARLTEGGVFCGWFNESHVLPKTVASVFPYTSHFRDWIVASNQPHSFDRDYMTEALDAYLANSEGLFVDSIRETLQPDTIFGWYKGDRDCTLAIEQNTPMLSDMKPRLEYYYFHPPLKKGALCK